MLYMQGTPTELASFALFLFRKYSAILFWAQINAVRMLQGSNHPVRYFVFKNILDILVIFTYTNALYARHTYWIGTYFFVLIHEIQPNIFPSPFWGNQNAIRLYLCCQHSGFSHYFVILRIFTNIEPFYVRLIHLTGIYYFVFIHRIQPIPF